MIVNFALRGLFSRIAGSCRCCLLTDSPRLSCLAAVAIGKLEPLVQCTDSQQFHDVDLSWLHCIAYLCSDLKDCEADKRGGLRTIGGLDFPVSSNPYFLLVMLKIIHRASNASSADFTCSLNSAALVH